MMSQNFRQCPAELHANRLLGQLSQNTLVGLVLIRASERLMMVIKIKGAHVELCLDQPCVQMIVVVSLYVE